MMEQINQPEVFKGKIVISSRKAAVIAVFLFAFILFNYSNIFAFNWFVHPDDHEAYVIGKQIKENGTMTMDEPLNYIFDEPLFKPSGTTWNGEKVVPTRAFGIYFLTALGLFFGPKGPFFVIPLIGMMGLLYLYLALRMAYNQDIALLSVLLFSFSAPVIYWNNMLYSNFPGLAFLIAGVYYTLRIDYGKKVKAGNYVAAAVFFALSVWMRYENSLFILLLLPLFIRAARYARLRYVVVGLLIFLIMLTPILILNKAVYGKAFTTGYIESKKNVEGEQGSEGVEETGFAKKLIRRFFLQDINPDFSRIYVNAKTYILKPFAFLVLIGILGLLLALSLSNRNRVLALSFLLISLVWTYDTCGGFHWGEGSFLVGSTYGRYLLIVYMALAIFTAYFLYKVKQLYGKKLYLPFVFLLLVAYLCLQMTVLFQGAFGLKDTVNQKRLFREVQELAEELPENAVIVGTIYAKAIVGRKVMMYDLIPDEQQPQRTVEYIKRLISMGYPVFILETSWHEATYRRIAEYMARNDKSVELREVGQIKFEQICEKVYEVECLEAER